MCVSSVSRAFSSVRCLFSFFCFSLPDLINSDTFCFVVFLSGERYFYRFPPPPPPWYYSTLLVSIALYPLICLKSSNYTLLCHAPNPIRYIRYRVPGIFYRSILYLTITRSLLSERIGVGAQIRWPRRPRARHCGDVLQRSSD